MSILNSTRPARVFALALSILVAPSFSAAQVSPKVRARLLKNARPGLQRTCASWSSFVSSTWLEVEEVGGLDCMRAKRLPEHAQRLVRSEFLKACTEDLTTLLNQEIDKHPKALTDYYLPDVSGEAMLAMYARSLWPSYLRYCADGPAPAIAPGNPPVEKGEISL